MTLTIIVTVFNIAKYLPRFFESMAKQTFGDYCLLMVDDGSEDNSLQVCNEYAAKDERIKVVSLEHVGIAKARNIAMGYIDTGFTAYADGDDYVEPGYLQHLMDAQKKYDADLVISRVAYHSENSDALDGCFPGRGELCFDRDEFPEKLPVLLDDRRLNYLYGKVYRSGLLRDIRVEDNVRQGSDTMINCQYIRNINRIVLIDDLDYHYIKYSGRSVTSYSGKDAFDRICRINRFVFKEMEDQGLLTAKMIEIIDKRVLLSAVWVIDKVLSSEDGLDKKIDSIDLILNNSDYKSALERYNRMPFNAGFEPIRDLSGEEYVRRIEKEKRLALCKEKILRLSPKWIHNAYRALLRK